MKLSAILQINLWDRIVAWYRSSLLHELFVHFSEDLYGIRFGGYENISLSQNAESVARMLIFALMAATLASGAAIVWTRTVPGGFVRRLLRLDATDPSRAVTLHRAGYFRSFGIRRDLARGGALSKVVKRAGDPYTPVAVLDDPSGIVARLSADPRKPASKPEPEKPKSAPDEPQKKENAAPAMPAPVNFLTDRFYIPEDLQYRAELRYSKKGSGVRAYLILAAVTLLFGFLLCRFLPLLFSFADFIIGAI